MLIVRRLFRFLLSLVIFFLVLPLLFYFAAGVQEGQVHFREPRGEAIKVWEEGVPDEKYSGLWGRLMYYISEFYQNGL